MDKAMKGHPYAKAPVDVACWDILGKTANLPASDLLGGTYGDDFVLYRAISQQSPEEMAQNVTGYREEGYRRFQLKVGGDPDADIERIRQVAAVLQPGDKLVADANTGWLKHEAMCVVGAVKDADVYIEQRLLALRGLFIRTPAHRPALRDGRIDRRNPRDSPRRAGSCHGRGQHQDQQVRRPDRHRQARDLCVSLGIAMTLEDTWGGTP